MSLIIKELSVFSNKMAILKDINLVIPECSHLSLMGHSGSGKSTLVRSILGLETNLIIKGSISFAGTILQGHHHSQKGLAYVPQNLGLWPHLSVQRTLELTRSFARSNLMVQEIMHMFDLLSLKNRFPKDLSQGEQQKLALARAIIARPRLLILDEPFSCLDTVNRYSMLKLVKDIAKNYALTTICITHDLAEAFFLEGDLLILYRGQNIWSGPSFKFNINLPQWPLLESHRSFYHRNWSAADVCFL